MYSGGYQDSLGPRRKALLDDMPDDPLKAHPIGPSLSPGTTPQSNASSPMLAPSPTAGGTNRWNKDLFGGQLTAPTGGAVNWQDQGAWTPENIAQYFQSRNTTPGATSVDYWVSKAPELIARGKELNDPDYAFKRLAAADEFGGGGGGGQGGSQPQGPFLDAFRQALLNNLGTLQQPITEDSPGLAGAFGAYRTQSSRTLDQAKKQIAEQQYANGQGGVSTEGEQQQRQAAERVGADEASFRAGLVNDADSRRQALLAQLLGLGGSFLQQDRSLGQQQDQFQDSLGFDWAQYLQNQNRDALLAGLGR